MNTDNVRAELLALLKRQSVFHGDFTLASGAKSSVYIDCRLTTFHPQGAWLVGESMYQLIRKTAQEKEVQIDAVGGLTMGADPVALAVGMFSFRDSRPLNVFSVRKEPKAHGQTKLIEGNFKSGNTVVVIDDVITRGESTLKAIDAVEKEGGKIAFVAALVDRAEGGRQRIEGKGYPVVSLFTKEDLLPDSSRP
jgi:orotate phosphoribosyltransferase